MKSITIYLGSRCNLNCAYCHRQADKDERGITEKLLKLLEEQRPQEIRFFGGEPTLYMDDIKKVVERCPWAAFTVTTNGVLLDKYIDYFRRHDFKIVLSYDGNDRGVRRFNPFAKAIDYHKIAVSTTLYHGNTDFKNILRGLCEAEKTAGRWLTFFPHIAHHTSGSNAAYALTEEDVDEILASYRNAVECFWRDYESYGVINRRYAPLFAQLLKEYGANYEFGETYCISRERLKVDADGNAFNCLYIRNLYADNNKEFMEKTFPRCRKCRCYAMCGGACVQSLSHDVECRFYYGLYSFFCGFLEKADKSRLAALRRILQC